MTSTAKNLNNIEFLAEELIDLDAQIKLLEKRAKELKSELKGMDIDEVVAHNGCITFSERSRFSFDKKKLVDEFGEDIMEYGKTTTSKVCSIKHFTGS